MTRTVSGPIGLLLLAVLLSACSPSPSRVAQEFYGHLAKGEIAAAKELSTARTAAMLDQVMATDGMKEEMSNNAGLKVIEEKIEGEKAKVTVGKGTSKGMVTLSKVDGEWKIDLLDGAKLD